MPDCATPHSPLLSAYFERRLNLVRYFTARLGSATQAEDLVQDLYLKVSELDKDLPVNNASALLFQIANNLMLDRLRTERRSQVREQAWSDISMVRGPAGEPRADEPSPEAEASDRQSLRQLMRALEDLAPRTRRAFELHKLRGLSYAQTAEAMGTSQKTIEKQISAALRQLTTCLGRRP